MDVFVIYIFHQVVFRISSFLRHWYLGGFFAIARFFVSAIESLDKSFALKVTWRHLFQPLFQDKSVIGYVLGFIFRFLRLILGLVIYFVILVLGFVIYLAWALVPIYLVYKATGNNFGDLKWI